MQSASLTLDFMVFASFRDLLRDKLGIFFGDNKVQFLEKRINQRIRDLDFESHNEYFYFLKFGDKDGNELQQLTNLITTNETYMFREYDQLEAFANHCIPEMHERKLSRGKKSLRIWSAGCSSGEEPYTLAIILKEILEDFNDWDIRIMATDVDENMLDLARKAEYGERSVKHVPHEYFENHLQAVNGNYQVKEATRKLVEFQHLNLHDRRSLRRMQGFDFIFCRNVLIYFDESARKSVVDQFYTSLSMGGYIFLGHSESVGRISTAFKLNRLGDHLVYSKS